MPFSSSTPARCPKPWTSSTGEERNRVYRMLRLEITPRPDGILDVRGILSDSLQIRHENGNAADDFVLTKRYLPVGRSVVRTASRIYEIGAM